jgi:hypothetical protein
MGAWEVGQMRRMLYPAAFVACLAPIVVSNARACLIDGKPSAFANGVRAVLDKQAPTPATWSWWAHFAFPVAFRVGQLIAFHEDDAQVRKVLEPAALRRPWRWRFGDGTSVVGNHATYGYRRPGHYRISVDAYFPGSGWQPFDTISMTVQR